MVDSPSKQLQITGLQKKLHLPLIMSKRLQQSWFMPGKATTDRILALCLLVKCQHKFQQGMFEAYVDLKKAFDSPHRGIFWISVGFLQGLLVY